MTAYNIIDQWFTRIRITEKNHTLRSSANRLNLAGMVQKQKLS